MEAEQDSAQRKSSDRLENHRIKSDRDSAQLVFYSAPVPHVSAGEGCPRYHSVVLSFVESYPVARSHVYE